MITSEQTLQARRLSIQKCIQSLLHACTCQDANCRQASCERLKRVMQHNMMCKQRQQNNCPVCKQLIALCWYHAKHCNDSKCMVPNCLNFKQKLQQQHNQQRLQAAMMMRRRIEAMQQSNNSNNHSNASTPSSSVCGKNNGKSNANIMQVGVTNYLSVGCWFLL